MVICKNDLPATPPKEYGNPALKPKFPPICASNTLFGPGVIELVKHKIAKGVISSIFLQNMPSILGCNLLEVKREIQPLVFLRPCIKPTGKIVL